MASSKFESLVGLLYDRTLGQRDVDYPHLQRLQRHLRQLRKRVPIIEVNMESAESLHKWDSKPHGLSQSGRATIWDASDLVRW